MRWKNFVLLPEIKDSDNFRLWRKEKKGVLGWNYINQERGGREKGIKKGRGREEEDNEQRWER